MKKSNYPKYKPTTFPFDLISNPNNLMDTLLNQNQSDKQSDAIQFDSSTLPLYKWNALMNQFEFNDAFKNQAMNQYFTDKNKEYIFTKPGIPQRIGNFANNNGMTLWSYPWRSANVLNLQNTTNEEISPLHNTLLPFTEDNYKFHDKEMHDYLIYESYLQNLFGKNNGVNIDSNTNDVNNINNVNNTNVNDNPNTLLNNSLNPLFGSSIMSKYIPNYLTSRYNINNDIVNTNNGNNNTTPVIDLKTGEPISNPKIQLDAPNTLSNAYSTLYNKPLTNTVTPINTNLNIKPFDSNLLNPNNNTNNNSIVPNSSNNNNNNNINTNTNSIITDNGNSNSNSNSNFGNMLLNGIRSIGNYLPTLGEMMGMYSQIKGANDLAKNSYLAFDMTQPNENPYEHYGERQVKAIEQGRQAIENNRQNQIKELDKQIQAQKYNSHNNARGINTLRMNNAMADMIKQNGINQINQQASNQQYQLLNTLSNVLGQKDQMFMQGEAQRDLANRQDLDNFFTNRAKDLSTRSTVWQNIGANLNEMQRQRVMQDLINLQSLFGISVNGKTGALSKK